MNNNTINEVKDLIVSYFNKKKKPIVFVSEEQNKFLEENKGLLFEYYAQVSNPRTDGYILGDLQVWVYGHDRKEFTPHCHVMLKDKSIEVEISIIDWKIINKKVGNLNASMTKAFKKWLDAKSSRAPMQTNKESLFMAWDFENPNNDLLTFIEKHNIIPTDILLLKYLKSQMIDDEEIMTT